MAYPQPCGAGFTEEVETFALQMLPEVLEKDCNYKLFIAGRDCLPGQGKSPTVIYKLECKVDANIYSIYLFIYLNYIYIYI